MSYDREILFEYIKKELDSRKIKYAIHNFENAAMIDIWIESSFYVIQIDDNSIGLSKVDNENPGFDTVPDGVFNDNKEFIGRFSLLLEK